MKDAQAIGSSYDRAVHSDFLVHWTGRDIDQELQPNWYGEDHDSDTDDEVAQRYLQRLGDILKYGVWMTEGGEQERRFHLGNHQFVIPPTPRCCFTELKLSESRRHAALYGRLGIGVKRPFLFERFGRPLAYFGFRENQHKDKLLEACAQDIKEKRLLNFFKPMNQRSGKLDYSFYSESEWRILWFEELIKSKRIIDPRDPHNEEHHAYFNSLTPNQQSALRYLIPLDGWFAMIIYPSLKVKNYAQWDSSLEIVSEIERIKGDITDHGNAVEGRRHSIGQKPFLGGNWPIEINLDACRHF